MRSRWSGLRSSYSVIVSRFYLAAVNFTLRAASPHCIRVPIAAKKSIPNITRSNMVGITKNGIHTCVPANSTRVRHNIFTARLDRSANAIVVMISCISFLGVGLLLRSSPLRLHLGDDVVCFPGRLGDKNRR